MGFCNSEIMLQDAAAGSPLAVSCTLQYSFPAKDRMVNNVECGLLHDSPAQPHSLCLPRQHHVWFITARPVATAPQLSRTLCHWKTHNEGIILAAFSQPGAVVNQ